MSLLVAQDWSATTWEFLFAGMAIVVLSIFVTFVMVLVRAAAAPPPPRAHTDHADVLDHPGMAGAGHNTHDDGHHHPHAA